MCDDEKKLLIAIKNIKEGKTGRLTGLQWKKNGCSVPIRQITNYIVPAAAGAAAM